MEFLRSNTSSDVWTIVEKLRHYFSWQFKLLSRSIKHFGLPPAVGYTLLVLLAFVLPALLWPEKSFFPWLYATVGLAATKPIRSDGRNEFLKICYSKRDFFFLRTTENLLIVLPFCIVLLIHKEFLIALGLFLIAFLLGFTAYWNRKRLNLPTLPTPFSKKPFEFALGFRVSFPLVVFLYYVVLMAIIHDNFNLGIVTVYAILITCMGYYFQMEPEYYVWLHDATPKRFLFQKLKTASLFAFSMVVVPVVALSVFFPKLIGFLMLGVLVGFLNLIITILLKYTEFPKPFHLVDWLLLTVCVISPIFPIAIIFLPLPLMFILFDKAQKNLYHYL